MPDITPDTGDTTENPNGGQANYFQVLHTLVGDKYAAGAIVTRDELKEKGGTVTRHVRLKAVKPLFNDQGKFLYEQQMKSGTRTVSGVNDEDRDDDDDFAAFDAPEGLSRANDPTASASFANPNLDDDNDEDDAAPAPPPAPKGKKAAEKPADPAAAANKPASATSDEYDAMSDADLQGVAAAFNVENYATLDRDTLLAAVRKAAGR